MKKIPVSKRTWRQLCKIKSKQNLSSLSKVIEYLINSRHILKGKSMQEIHRHVDALINAKNLEANMDIQQSKAGEKGRLIFHEMV